MSAESVCRRGLSFRGSRLLFTIDHRDPTHPGGPGWMGHPTFNALMALSIIETLPLFLLFVIFREEIMKGVRLQGLK